jgi:hypothetical protein
MAGRLQFDVDGAACAPHQVHSPDAAHVLQALFQHLFRPVGQLGTDWARWAVWVSGSTATDQMARLAGSNRSTLGSFTSVAQSGLEQRNFFAHIFGCPAAVHVQTELDDHDRLALVAARRQRIDARNGVDRFLDLLGHLGFNDFRCSTGVLGGDHHHRKVDVGELVHLQALDGEQPHDHESQHHHRREDGLFRLTLVNHMAGRGRQARRAGE